MSETIEVPLYLPAQAAVPHGKRFEECTDERTSCEERLAQLAASFGPLRRVLAAIAARMLDDRLYEPLCFRVLRDYAAERAGVSARQLQELARVHRRIAGLPLLAIW